MHTLPASFWGPTATAPRVWRLRAREEAPGLSWRFFLLGLLLLLLAAGGGLLYIREITSTAASGYDVTALERRAGALREDEARLELEAAELQSLERIQERVRTLNLVPVGDLAYTSPIVEGTVTGQVPVGTARR